MDASQLMPMPKVSDRSKGKISLQVNPVDPHWVVEGDRTLALASVGEYPVWVNWQPPKYFGAWVRRERAAIGWRQTDLAAKVSCSQRYISQIECGDRTASYELKKAIVDVLVAAKDLCCDSTDKNRFMP